MYQFWIALGVALLVPCTEAEAQFEADHLLPGYSIVVEAPDGDVFEVVGPFALI
jgi:hypothetical protein